MSCPDWTALARERAAEPLCDPDGFAAALEHSEACPACRRAALAADPLVLFRAPASQGDRAGTAAEIRSMQDSVLALVRASRVAGAPGKAAGEARTRWRSGYRYAAGLAVFSILALSGGPPATDRAAASNPGAGEISAWVDQTIEGVDVGPPAVEELDRLGARIYELPQRDLSVVMIVDSSLDV